MVSQPPYVVCPKCERVVEEADEGSATESVRRHNEEWHDGSQVSLVARPTIEDAERIIERAKDVLSASELDLFRCYLRREKVMDRYFNWDGKNDKWHDDFEDYKELDEIMGF